MKFVGKFTSVRVPIVHAFFIDDTSKMGFLVEERLPGCTLEEALPQMDENTQEVIINEFRNIYSQLDTLSSRRDSLGPLHGPWNNQWFHTLAEHFPIDEDTGRSVNTFLKYFYDVPGYYNIYRPKPSFEGIMSSFDLSKPPVFSHGDLMPCNIMVENGHIVGVIDWAEAGWYPYFWDSYVLECTMFSREELDAAPM
ncbi:kinase-like domain-containing protein [Abortiporus biennis]|nr:kinase-like domain-containing protein [Abortiporus biennis]